MFPRMPDRWKRSQNKPEFLNCSCWLELLANTKPCATQMMLAPAPSKTAELERTMVEVRRSWKQ